MIPRMTIIMIKMVKCVEISENEKILHIIHFYSAIKQQKQAVNSFRGRQNQKSIGYIAFSFKTHRKICQSGANLLVQ